MGEYCDSCNEYMDIVAHPEPHFDCGDWADQFANWSAVQVWVYAIVGLVWIIYGIAHGCNCVGHMFAHFAVGLLIAYFFAHLGWFIVVRQEGCIHPIVCLIFGIIYILHGLNWLAYAIDGHYRVHYGLHYAPAEGQHWSDSTSVLLRQILYAVYAITLLYMGVSASMMFISGQASRGLEMEDFDERPRGRKRRNVEPDDV